MNRRWAGPAIGAMTLVLAVVTGNVSNWWLVWLIFWLTDATSLFVTERLVYWQRRHIEALKESQRLDGWCVEGDG